MTRFRTKPLARRRATKRPPAAQWKARAGLKKMPKHKTHKGLKKRFRLTAKGKIKHRCAGTSHLASRKVKKTRRNLRGTRVVSKTVLKQITRALAGHSS